MILENVNNELIQYSTCGFAKNEAIFNEKKQMIDYIFLEVNQTFEIITGLKKEDVIGKRFLRDISKDKEKAAKWIKLCEKVVNEKNPVIFNECDYQDEQEFSVIAYASKNKQFVTLFLDKKIENKMQEIAKYYGSTVSTIDYDKITEFAYDLSGAQYVALNIYDENGKALTTVSLRGASNRFQKKLKSLKIDLVGKTRSYSSTKEMIKEISCIDSVYDFLRKEIPERVALQIEKNFDIDNVVVAKIKNQNKLLGDFTLFFKDGDYLRNRSIFQLFLTQLGLFIEKIRLEQALKVSQSRFFTLAEYAPVGFVSCDLDGKIIYANKKILDMLNTPSLEEMRAVNLFESSSFEKLGFSEKLSECMEMDKGITYEIGYKSIWGKDSWLRIHYNPHKENGHIVGANIIVDDITDIKAKEVTLKEQALRDPLTNAYNRYALDTIVLDRLNESKEEQLIDCFALVNVDNFKEINDNYGHEVGDRVLKYLTTRVIKEFRGNDLVVRTGGDEFLIYFHDIKQVENANCVIERLFHKISTKYRFIDDMDGSCYGINVSCSIGVSIYPKDGNSLNELMSKADIALSHIKKSGKSNYYIEA